MNCHGKNRFTTRAAASRKAQRDFKRLGVRLYPYPCSCGGFHLTKRKLAEFLTDARDRDLRAIARVQGQEIANDEIRAAKKKVAELAPIVADDREWLRRMKDAAEFREACASALRSMLDDHFTSRTN